MADSRYDILFEPVKIGPVTAKNRFYQVPHCNGMGHRFTKSLAGLRGMKAEGGWGVIATEMVEIHHSADTSPRNEGRLWTDRDIPAQRMVTDAIHEHGALAAIELGHTGALSDNHYSRVPPLAPSSNVQFYGVSPIHSREMDKTDIANLRRWHKQAAIRAKTAGHDIIYVYAGHNLSLLSHFLNPKLNRRSDEYGGSLENRVRVVREILQDTKEAVGDTCGIAFRYSVDEMRGDDGLQWQEEGRAVVEMLAELPDIWDVNVAGWDKDSATSRFKEEGFQQEYVNFVKQVTNKPVVGVGRFTSPDAMVSQIKRGVLDCIGAARPSIADPFLPNKIKEGRLDEIRECIGCNICVSGDNQMVPIRCTQNPTMGEEWRKGWHPEKIRPAESDDAVLIVGAGPAGLEAALQLGKRGYEVTLADKATQVGGRVTRESALPGLAAWSRVRDHRQLLLQQMPNVNIYLESELNAEQVREFGFPRVVLATGAKWRRDCVGRMAYGPPEGLDQLKEVLTPDDLMDGRMPAGDNIVIYDDDQYYMASVMAEHCAKAGKTVTLITPGSVVAAWTEHTLEQYAVQSHMHKVGVKVVTANILVSASEKDVTTAEMYSGELSTFDADALVLVTSRLPDDSLYRDLVADPKANEAAGIRTIQLIGDGYNPALIANAVYAGRLLAEEFDTFVDPDVPNFKREDSHMCVDN